MGGLFRRHRPRMTSPVSELVDLLAVLERTGLRPRVDRVLDLADAGAALTALDSGAVAGKVVLVPPTA